jgi:hypothetical protein
MPSRSWTLAILAFWLGTMGWYCYKVVWPRLRPGERPPYTIDLSDEITGLEPRRWDLYRNGRRVGWANTWVKYRYQDNTYKVTGKYVFHSPQDQGGRADDSAPENQKMVFPFLAGTVQVQVNEFDSTNWITRDGDLRELDGGVSLTAIGPPGVLGPRGRYDIQAHVSGRVEGGYLRPHWKLERPWALEHETEPILVANNHSVLNPLQPWNRLRNIRPGQTWRVQLFDPLTESATASIKALIPVSLPKVEYLDAVVQEIPDDRPWGNPPQQVSCLIVEYRGDKLHAWTWVRRSDGLVLRQEAVRNEGATYEERLALERNPR